MTWGGVLLSCINIKEKQDAGDMGCALKVGQSFGEIHWDTGHRAQNGDCPR